MPIVADEQFVISYDGPDLSSNSMDVRLLAPALLGLADVMQSAARVMDPTGPPPGLQIEATAPGSFAVHLILLDPANTLNRVVDLLSGRDTTAAVNAGALFGMATGAITLLVRLSGRRIRGQEDVRPGWVRISFDDATTLDLPSTSVTLAGDLDFRRAANQMVEPLRLEGIDKLAIVQADIEVVTVVRGDLAGFDVPEVGDVLLSEQDREVALRLLNVAFIPGNKWRVSDGDNDLYVTVADLQFLHRVETNQESFSAGDLLMCQLKTEQWQTRSGALRNDHTVVRVIDHIQGPRTVPLPFEQEPPGESEVPPAPAP